MSRIRLFVCLGLVAASCSTSTADVLPPDFRVDDKSAADWSAEWWKWAMSSPHDINPVRDETGEHCGVGQSGPVWFLAGGYGSSRITRRCTVPEGKLLFFPAVNMVYWPRRSNMLYTCEQATQAAAVNNDTALELFVEVDGGQLANPERYRARTTRCFNIFERVPDEYSPYNAFPSASDGFWYMLNPLPVGEHTIRFGGRYNNPQAGSDYGGMVQDIEYLLTVE